MARVVKHHHKLEEHPVYRIIEKDNNYFIYGEGPFKAKKREIEEIPDFAYAGSPYSVYELLSFILEDREYYLTYISEFGHRAIADQIGIREQDVATRKNWELLGHSEKNPDLIDYLSEVKKEYDHFMRLMKGSSELDDSTKFFIKEMNFGKFCMYDWMCGSWAVNVINASPSGNGTTSLTYLLERYAEKKGLGEVSIKETLNHLSNGTLGDRIEKVLTYHSWKEKRQEIEGV